MPKRTSKKEVGEQTEDQLGFNPRASIGYPDPMDEKDQSAPPAELID